VGCTVQLQMPMEDLPPAPPKLSRWVSQATLVTALAARCPNSSWPTADIQVLVRSVVDALVEAIPVAPSSARTAKPWFNSACFEARAALSQANILFETHPCMRALCMDYKRQYKRVLDQARRDWQESQELRLLAEAEARPYRYGQTVKSRVICPIPAGRMRSHFNDIAGGVSSAPTTHPPMPSRVLSIEEHYWSTRLSDPFTIEEVEAVINTLPHGKAEGPDRLRYEHLKGSPELTSILTFIFNRCLNEAYFPRDWAECLMILIPKGKGDLSEPDAWRGISKKAVMGKLFASLLAKRLLRFLSNCGFLPAEQHGFLPGRSTITALEALMAHLKTNLREGGTPVYAIFVDFKAAFNTASRTSIIKTLSEYGVGGPFLAVINAMLAPNMVKLFDGLALLPEFVQDTGLPQGDTISSLLFVVLLMGLQEHIQSRSVGTVTQLYADDLLMLHRILSALHEATRASMEFAAERGLLINWGKTKMIKFRRGGPLAASDSLTVEGVVIPFVSNFCYLGLTITVTASTFKRHLIDRKAKTVTAINQLRKLSHMSLRSALSLFDVRFAPMAYYGIQVYWEFLRPADFAILDSVLFVYLKRVLAVSPYSRSRLVLLLSGAKLTSEKVMKMFDLPVTPNFSRYLNEIENKLDAVDPEFHATPAMRDRTWAAPLGNNRSAVCRHAIHGFHHVFCATDGFHEPVDSCLCHLCGEHCLTYHSTVCQASPFSSIAQLAAYN
jgi:hypothetical protein